MKPKRTFVILANEQEARFLQSEGPGKGLTELVALENGEGVRYAERPGRSQAAPGTGRHGFDRPTSEREQDRERFAAEVAKAAEARWAKGNYDRALMAAPPKMLGALRAEIGKELSDAMVADLPKDLLKIRVEDLPAHFEDVIIL